jgi:hypothetical protein
MRSAVDRLVRPASRGQDGLGLATLVPGLAATIGLAGASHGALGLGEAVMSLRWPPRAAISPGL